MLRELKWSTLEQRRNQASLTMLHKIHNKQVNVDHSHLTTTRNLRLPHVVSIDYWQYKDEVEVEVLRSALFWHCVLRTAIILPRLLRTVKQQKQPF